VTSMYARSTSGMSVSFVRRLSSFQSIDPESSGRRGCQSLSNGHERIPVRCVAAATINKWLTCLQGVLNWARRNGVIPEEVPWADPVAGMRLKEPRSKRRPWEPEELSLLFGSSIYRLGERPLGGKGEAAYGLPLLTLFTGARLNELAPMCANDVKLDPSSGVHFMTVVEDDETGRTVKTENSLRAIPLHPELLRIGFLKFADHRRKADGPEARLFLKFSRTPRETTGPDFHSGSVVINVRSASTIRRAYFIRSGTASRTHCALRA
jgi:hypothetical protein